MLENILLIIVGFFLLLKGADILVEGASSIAKRFKISKLIIGLTVVAIGTSLPELIIGIKSSLIGESDVIIGFIVGSNIFNILVILGICSIIAPIKFTKESKFIDIPISLVIIFTFFILANNSGIEKSITKPEGIILLILFLCFFSYTIFIKKYGQIVDPKVELISDEEEDQNIVKIIFFIISGIIALKFGGDFVVDNITEIIKNSGIDKRIFSLILISICTSLPELSTSFMASLKKEEEIAIGNIIGSNIFNISLILGLSSIISDVKYSVEYNVDVMFMFISTVLLLIFPLLGKKNYISKRKGIGFILIYIVYMMSLFIK